MQHASTTVLSGQNTVSLDWLLTELLSGYGPMLYVEGRNSAQLDRSIPSSSIKLKQKFRRASDPRCFVYQLELVPKNLMLVPVDARVVAKRSRNGEDEQVWCIYKGNSRLVQLDGNTMFGFETEEAGPTVLPDATVQMLVLTQVS